MSGRGTSYEGSRPAGPSSGQRRVALVIGNGRYSHADPLPNPANDARAMAEVLFRLGFEVVKGIDLDLRAMGDVQVEYEDKLRGHPDVALLFYAGHGLQVKGRNYLVPIDAEITAPGHLSTRAIQFNDILEPMSEDARDRANIIFLDACRNNPFTRNLTRALGETHRLMGVRGGLAKIEKVAGTFISYATAPDETASDGQGANSPFTSALLQHIETPGLSIGDMMIDVRNAVLAETNNSQDPWEQSNLRSKFYFVPEEAVPAAPLALTGAAEEWASIHNTTSLATLALFKERYPDPPWGEYAAIRAGELRLADQQRREAEEAEAARKKIAEEQAELAAEPAARPVAAERPVSTTGATATAATAHEAKPHERTEQAQQVTGAAISRKKRFPIALLGSGAAVALAVLLTIWQPWKDPVQPAPPIVEDKTKTKTAAVKQSAARLPFEPEMVRVPGGTFKMGCVSGKGCPSNEKPVHRVTIKPFEVGKYEVTFAQWDACVADGGCGRKPNDQGWGRGRRPVINVSWDDITKQYLPWLKRKTGKAYRLLTEAEWEYAARARSEKKYSWGNTASHEQANYGKDECCGGLVKGRDKWENTAPVGKFPANDFGLYDMHGNVWEWVQDCYKDSYKGAPKDGSKVLDTSSCLRVARGGSWVVRPQDLRSAFRSRLQPVLRNYVIGFRLARTLNP